MTYATKPNLASAVKDLDKLRYPLYASPKIDGIRCWLHEKHRVVARSLKPIPNKRAHVLLSGFSSRNLDGELVTLDKYGKMRSFNEIQSDIMSRNPEGRYALQYLVFDITDSDRPFRERMELLRQRIPVVPKGGFELISMVPQTLVHSVEELEKYEAAMLTAGFEGVMVRDPEGKYKSGRSTVREGGLLKLKRFEDAEGIIVGFEEMMHNLNAPEVNELGAAKRSLAKGGMVPAGTMGKVVVVAPPWGEVRIGTGFTAAQRHEFWMHRHTYVGKMVSFKYQAFGTQDKPRLPVFRGLRDERDMS